MLPQAVRTAQGRVVLVPEPMCLTAIYWFSGALAKWRWLPVVHQRYGRINLASSAPGRPKRLPHKADVLIAGLAVTWSFGVEGDSDAKMNRKSDMVRDGHLFGNSNRLKKLR